MPSFSLATFGAPCLQLTSKVGELFFQVAPIWVLKKNPTKKNQPWPSTAIHPPTIPIPIDSKWLRTEGVASIQVLLPSDKLKLHSFVSRLHPTSVESRWPPSWGFMVKKTRILTKPKGVGGLCVFFWGEPWKTGGKLAHVLFFLVEIFHINFWSKTIGVSCKKVWNCRDGISDHSITLISISIFSGSKCSICYPHRRYIFSSPWNAHPFITPLPSSWYSRCCCSTERLNEAVASRVSSAHRRFAAMDKRMGRANHGLDCFLFVWEVIFQNLSKIYL